MSTAPFDVAANGLVPFGAPAPPFLPTSTAVAPVATGLQMKQRNPIAGLLAVLSGFGRFDLRVAG
jgi:hypothetical protein